MQFVNQFVNSDSQIYPDFTQMKNAVLLSCVKPDSGVCD